MHIYFIEPNTLDKIAPPVPMGCQGTRRFFLVSPVAVKIYAVHRLDVLIQPVNKFL